MESIVLCHPEFQQLERQHQHLALEQRLDFAIDQRCYRLNVAVLNFHLRYNEHKLEPEHDE